jgi:hypothetical protein
MNDFSVAASTPLLLVFGCVGQIPRVITLSGTVAYNQGVSQRRAQVVRGYLVSRDIAADRAPTTAPAT